MSSLQVLQTAHVITFRNTSYMRWCTKHHVPWNGIVTFRHSTNLAVHCVTKRRGNKQVVLCVDRIQKNGWSTLQLRPNHFEFLTRRCREAIFDTSEEAAKMHRAGSAVCTEVCTLQSIDGMWCFPIHLLACEINFTTSFGKPNCLPHPPLGADTMCSKCVYRHLCLM